MADQPDAFHVTDVALWRNATVTGPNSLQAANITWSLNTGESLE